MEVFRYNKSDFQDTCYSWTDKSILQSQFDEKLRDHWDKALENGQFRYKLDIEKTKIVGEKKYIAQLNELRAQERRKPDAINSVNQPFNPASFNFTKIKQGEILFEIVKDSTGSSTESQNGSVDSDKDGEVKTKRNLVIINVSPLEYGHVLLVPDVDACLPQILTEEAIQLSIDCMLLSKHRGFHVGFNSLCAYASVNHLHVHAYYIEHELFIESAPVDKLCDNLYELTCMPVKAFAFQLHNCDIKKLSRLFYNITNYFLNHEIAYNFFMTRGPVFGEDKCSNNRTLRIYLWPRTKFIGLKDEAAFNVALVELAGHLPIKVPKLFDDLDEKLIEYTMSRVALDPDEYNKIKQDVIQICTQSNTQ